MTKTEESERSRRWCSLFLISLVVTMWACEYPEPIAERGDRIRLTSDVPNFIAGLDRGVEGVCLGHHRPGAENRQFGPWIYTVYFPRPRGFTCGFYSRVEKVGDDGWELDDTDGFLQNKTLRGRK
jgi:hypothetical protein